MEEITNQEEGRDEGKEEKITFQSLGLQPDLLTAISYMGFEFATPIQKQAIPVISEGRDLIACAQTGTGKTAAFVLPVLNHMLKKQGGSSQALILVPTRELALQIDQQVEGMCYGMGISSMAIYGGGKGENWDQEKAALTEGANLIIATPGKLIAHLNQGYVNFNHLDFVILDEADRMLDIGFYEDIIRIFSHLPEKRQTLMFSATMPKKIRDLAKQVLNDPFEISLSISKPAEGVLQAAYLAHDDQKEDLLVRLLRDKDDLNSIIIFGPTRKSVKDIVRHMRKHNLDAFWISSDLEQSEREEIMRKFRNKQIRILVATDVISRGIDVKDIQLVVNYSVPPDPEDYVHRVGRTARAASTGVAITFINKDDMRRFSRIEEMIEREIVKQQPPEELGPGPEWNPGKREGSKGKKRKFYGKKKGGNKN